MNRTKHFFGGFGLVLCLLAGCAVTLQPAGLTEGGTGVGGGTGTNDGGVGGVGGGSGTDVGAGGEESLNWIVGWSLSIPGPAALEYTGVLSSCDGLWDVSVAYSAASGLILGNGEAEFSIPAGGNSVEVIIPFSGMIDAGTDGELLFDDPLRMTLTLLPLALSADITVESNGEGQLFTEIGPVPFKSVAAEDFTETLELNPFCIPLVPLVPKTVSE